jgi:hypothetical protein
MISLQIMKMKKNLIFHNMNLTDIIKILMFKKKKIEIHIFKYQKAKAKYHSLDFLRDKKN